MSVGSVPPSSGNSGGSSVAPSSTSTATPASIIAQLGIGTTLPISAILAGLLNIDSIPLVNLQNQVTGINTEITAYGSLSLALSTFQDAVQQLTLPTEFGALTATSSNTSVLSATAVPGALLGNETIDVTALAQAQSIATAGQASQSTSLATGTSSSTVTFSFGTETAATSTSPASFTANPALAAGSITIDSSNDTLQGIRDAINSATNLNGVTAQIVNNGSTSQLVITSASGASQAVHISVSGDSGISSLLTYPPATGTTTGPTETVAGQDAALTINGVSVTSPTNSITASIPDLSLTLTATGTTTLTVAQDNTSTQKNIDAFVSAYNVLQTEISSLTAFNAATGGTNGPLIGDSTTLNVQSSLQSILASALTGTGKGGLTTLASVGVTLNADGTLSVADSVLSAALAANPAAITSLFATSGSSTSSNLTYLVAGSAAQQGSYAVNVTHQATSASAVGTTALGSTTNFASPTSLSVSLDGVNASVTIPAGTYSPSSLASELQGLINSNTTFQTGGLAANVSINSAGELSIAGTDFGSAATIKVSGDADTTLFGSGGATVTAGTDVQGTIGGIAATGQGQTLTGNKGTAVDGLEIQVAGGGTGNVGTINFSQGYAAQLNTALTSALASTGPIAAATTNLNNQITALNTQETATQAFITSQQQQLQAEFSALDATLAALQNQSSFLQQTFNPTTTSG
ncbi:flagellar filament capping protein FliD [Burkholderia sp. L27(2015)]|uniref:flagellar filament capping protein FliD n=1 Tax=Burkholderia sp. L27(2015) TaxID=1641858 RepID=UPI00131E38A4|nr:flagellar filament capping protein FliD [Burkholderia sp. L27(2015)]